MMKGEHAQTEQGEGPKDEGPKGFTLVAEGDGTVGPTDLAKIIERKTGHRPTAQTIRNHAVKGTITGTKEPDRGWRFSPAAAEEWVNNRPPPKHGGRRKGAGKRRNATRPSQTLTGPVADAHAARDAISERMRLDEDGHKGPPPEGAMLVTDVLSCTRDELKALIQFNRPDRLMNAVEIGRIKDIQDLQFSDLKLAQQRGELVKGSQIEQAWAQEQARIVNQVLAVSGRIAGRLATAAWISEEQVSDICRMLHHEGVESDTVTVVGQMMARPADLEGRIRVMIDHEIGKMMADVASPPGDEEKK